MPNITAGRSASVALEQGQKITISGAATSVVASRAQSAPIRSVLGANTVIGPFNQRTTIQISADSAVRFDVSGRSGQSVTWPQKFGRFLSGLDAMQRGESDCRIAILGDSTDGGAFAYGVVWAGAAGGTPARALGPLLAQDLGNVVANSVFGNGTSSLVGAYDSRIVTSTNNWTVFSPGWLGGSCFRNDTNEVSVLSFTPEAEFDTVTVYYLGSVGGGSFSVSFDGQVVGAVVSTNSGSLQTLSVSRTSTTVARVVQITRQAGAGAVPIYGIVCSNSQRRAVQVMQWGAGGTAAANWIDTASAPLYSLFEGISLVAPHLCIIRLGINDNITTPVSTSVFASNLTTLVNGCRAAGADVLLATCNPLAAGTSPVLTQDGYYRETRNLANALGVPIVDIYQAFGTHAAAVSNGYFLPANDPIHPGAAGYQLMAKVMMQALRS